MEGRDAIGGGAGYCWVGGEGVGKHVKLKLKPKLKNGSPRSLFFTRACYMGLLS